MNTESSLTTTGWRSLSPPLPISSLGIRGQCLQPSGGLAGLDMNKADKGKGLAQMMIATLVLILISCMALALLVARLELLYGNPVLSLGY